MKVMIGFFLCFLICATVSSANEILAKTTLTASGRIHHQFTNTNVNTDKYDDEYSFRGMSASERIQADRIDRERTKERNEEVAATQRRVNEEARAKQAEIMAKRELELERARRTPISVSVSPSMPPQPAPIIVNNW